MLRRCRSLLDAPSALIVLGVTAIRMMLFRRRAFVRSQGLVVLDSSYTLDEINQKDLHWSISGRDCEGLFSHVWSVHPIVGAGNRPPTGCSLRVEELSPGHTFIEVHTSVGRRWSAFPLTAFALSQRQLLGYLRRIVGSGRVSAIRVGDPYYLGLLGYLLVKRTNLALAVRISGDYDALFEATGLPAYPRLLRFRWVEKWIDRFVLRRAELVFAPTSHYRSFAIANGARVGSCVIVPFTGLLHPSHFVEPIDRLPVKPELGLGQRPVLVAVTRLEPVKRAVDLVEVLVGVREKFPDASLVVVGEGSQRSEMLDLVDSRDLVKDFLLIGSRAQEWIASFLAEADVVVAPMMGRALVEAALSATPIVAYDTDWHGELIDDGETGRLVSCGDVAAMTRAVCDLLTQRESGRIMGGFARLRVMDSMSRDTVLAAEREAWARLVPHLVDEDPGDSHTPDKTEGTGGR